MDLNIKIIKKFLNEKLERIGLSYVSGKTTIQESSVHAWNLEQETLDAYAAILKKVISGTREKTLFALPVGEGRQELLRDKDQVLSILCEKAPVEGRFAAMAAGCTFDDQEVAICCICPAKQVRPGLSYDEKQKLFVDKSLGWAIKAPVMGFMYPFIDDEYGVDLNRALLFSSKKEYMPEALLQELFGTGSVMTEKEQKEAFKKIVEGCLARECSFDRVTDILEQVEDAGRALEEKGQDKALGSAELGRIIERAGGSAKDFEEKFEEAIGHAGTIFPDCVCDKGRLTVETDAGKVVSGKEGAQLLRTRVIDGIEYLLVPMSGEVTVNGIRVLKKA